jgi:hypothetical protein
MSPSVLGDSRALAASAFSDRSLARLVCLMFAPMIMRKLTLDKGRSDLSILLSFWEFICQLQTQEWPSECFERDDFSQRLPTGSAYPRAK